MQSIWLLQWMPKILMPKPETCVASVPNSCAAFLCVISLSLNTSSPYVGSLVTCAIAAREKSIMEGCKETIVTIGIRNLETMGMDVILICY